MPSWAWVWLWLVLLGITGASDAGEQTGPKIRLQHVYTYSTPQGWRGELRAFLDGDSGYLYVAQSASAQFQLKKIDWKTGKTVLEEDYSEWSCKEEGIVLWYPVPGTRYIHLSYCRHQYVLERDSLAVVRRMVEPLPGHGLAFSPTGEFVVVSRFVEVEKQLRHSLFSVVPWKEITDSNLSGRTPFFTLDAQYVVTKVLKEGPSIFVEECGLDFYEMPSLRLANRWALDPKKDHCPHRPVLIPGTRYHAVDYDWGRGLVVQDLWTGQTLGVLRGDVPFLRNPSVSPDGRFVVAGAWDDPQDQPWSRDFIIWDLLTREIVYQTPRYRSVWGRNTTGREVYPSFSPDGQYLVVVRENAVELHRIVFPAESAAR